MPDPGPAEPASAQHALGNPLRKVALGVVGAIILLFALSIVMERLTPSSSQAVVQAYFLILFGTGISPLPTTTPESFSTRIGYVLLAVTYTLCVASLLWPREGRQSARGTGRLSTP